MTKRKYSDKEKLDAVSAYEKGSQSYEAAARLLGIGHYSLKQWVAGFRALGPAGVVTRTPRHYSAKFKLEVLRRMKDEKLSCRQAGAIFDVRRTNQIAEWARAYAKYGVEALQPYWSAMGARIGKTLDQKVASMAAPDDSKLTREQLLRELQLARTEVAYLKKVQALARAQTLTAPEKGR